MVNQIREGDRMTTLLLALGSLLTWSFLTFGVAPRSGAIHLLLALGATLLVRWWALRA